MSKEKTTMAQEILSTPLELGNLHLKNRIVMAPMTRGRAGDSRVPNELMAEYYRQRASAGLLITEATVISPEGNGWVGSPGIYTDEMVVGWRKVTQKVQDARIPIFLQLWHCGRASHSDFHNGALPLSAAQTYFRMPDQVTNLEVFLSDAEKALGPEHPDVGTPLNNLAGVYEDQGRYAEAEPLYKRSLAVWEKALGLEHPNVSASHNNLALLYQAQGRYAEAEPLYKCSLAIREKTLGPEHPYVGITLNNLAELAMVQSDWARAGDYWWRSTGVIKRRAERGLAGGRGEASGGEAQRLRSEFWGLVKVSHRLAGQSPAAAPAAEMFETAQWAQGSEAAASLAQMAARSAKGSPQLAGLVRERQDLVGEWQDKDKQLIANKSEPPARRKGEAEKVLAERLVAIDNRLAEIEQRLKTEFPDYAALASPAPVSVADVQAHLGADEALVLFLDTPEWRPLPEESFIWVVTKTQVRWVRSELGTAALTREVAALRCGLDAAAWGGDGNEKCSKAVGPRTRPLRFDNARAHALYTALFGQVQDLIKGKHLLIVPSGPLTQPQARCGPSHTVGLQHGGRRGHERGSALGPSASLHLRTGQSPAGLSLGGQLGRYGQADYRHRARDGPRSEGGRAEALRRSMLALIETGAAHEAHPAYWAPFALVGEGGRGR
jgi:tetratricopeptide (TPR) repeat protein